MKTIPEQRHEEDHRAWNEAHDRLSDFLNTFTLGDHIQVSRLTLQLLDQAREQHRQNPTSHPVSLVMAQTQKITGEWLASSLEIKSAPRSQLFASGYIALLLSRTFQTAPDSFLVGELPESPKESMRRTLLVVGPDLQISSMTPRHLDYGPMLDLARKTWHRWNSREIFTAVLFWTAVYFIFYWWFSATL